MLTASRLSQTAAHESGHCICAVARGVPIEKVVLCIGNDSDVPGYMSFAESSECIGPFDLLIVALGGFLAEQLFAFNPTAKLSRSDSDLVASKLSALYKKTEFRLEHRMMQSAEREARKILHERADEVRVLAAMLEKHTEISGADVEMIVTKIRSDRLLNQLQEVVAREARRRRRGI